MRPLIGICGTRNFADGVEQDIVRSRYVAAVRNVVEGMPLLIPLSIKSRSDARELLSSLDGLLMTGSQSNIAAEWYGHHQLPGAACLDLSRDAAALHLIPEAILSGVPFLGICRGHQELNVAYGGDLYQDLSAEFHSIVHKEDTNLPRDVQYQPSHEVRIVGSLLRSILRGNRAMVNSLHNQGIRSIGPGLIPEAISEDGLVESLSVSGSPSFALSVQWHPEWHYGSDRVSIAIFDAFGTACRERMSRRFLVAMDGANARQAHCG